MRRKRSVLQGALQAKYTRAVFTWETHGRVVRARIRHPAPAGPIRHTSRSKSPGRGGSRARQRGFLRRHISACLTGRVSALHSYQHNNQNLLFFFSRPLSRTFARKRSRWPSRTSKYQPPSGGRLIHTFTPKTIPLFLISLSFPLFLVQPQFSHLSFLLFYLFFLILARTRCQFFYFNISRTVVN